MAPSSSLDSLACRSLYNSLHSLNPFRSFTIRHKHISYPKKICSNYFLITVARFEISRINFRKLPRYLLHLCELRDSTRLGPLSLLNYFSLPLPGLKFSELIG